MVLSSILKNGTGFPMISHHRVGSTAKSIQLIFDRLVKDPPIMTSRSRSSIPALVGVFRGMVAALESRLGGGDRRSSAIASRDSTSGESQRRWSYP